MEPGGELTVSNTGSPGRPLSAAAWGHMLVHSSSTAATVGVACDHCRPWQRASGSCHPLRDGCPRLVQGLGDDVDQRGPAALERGRERRPEVGRILHPPRPDAVCLGDPRVLPWREVDREIGSANPLFCPALIQPKVAFAITTRVIGRPSRAMVSSSPEAKPKLPSPMTAIHFASGRPI